MTFIQHLLVFDGQQWAVLGIIVVPLIIALFLLFRAFFTDSVPDQPLDFRDFDRFLKERGTRTTRRLEEKPAQDPEGNWVITPGKYVVRFRPSDTYSRFISLFVKGEWILHFIVRVRRVARRRKVRT